MDRLAEYWTKLEDNNVRCDLCPHYCIIPDGRSGICRSRTNQAGTLYATNYAKCTGIAIDPIEKKPLYHFRPGSQILSLGPNSCNLGCYFCQNYQISLLECKTIELSPEALNELVLSNGLKQVAFTYTEPITWFEYIKDFACLANGIDIVLVTNGYVNIEPLEELCSYVKAMNIDIKSASDEFYKRACKGSIEPVIAAIKTVLKRKVHLEITNLIIPTENDAPDDFNRLIEICSGISKDIPIHFSAYHPAYKARIEATEIGIVIEACKIASDKMHFVYAGNIGVSEYISTKCPSCGQTLITRDRLQSELMITGDGSCKYCRSVITGVFA